MFQTFTTTADPSQGAPRLARLRARMAEAGLAGYLVPRADAHQGEYVAPHDDRLAWLTGFTGSAGFCVVLEDRAGVFIDGRYRLQVKSQVDLAVYTPVPWPEVQAGDWIAENMQSGQLGFDPWLHTAAEIEQIEAALASTGLRLVACDNLVDAIWSDQPPPPKGRAFVQPDEIAGQSSSAKRATLAEALRKAGQRAAVITLPDSLCWLLNIRGADVPRNPVAHGFAILGDDGRLSLCADAEKFDAELRAHLGEEVTLLPVAAFVPALAAVEGPVRVDKATAPLAVSRALEAAGIRVDWAQDPCLLPKAVKNATELSGMREAHLRDAAALAEFLCWLDRHAPAGGLTEIDVVRALEGFRRDTNVLHDISFDTICGAGPHGAIMHYRVTEASNRAVGQNELLLVDSGAQYQDGTTDITRTIAVGDPGLAARQQYTRVLQGLIALSRARFPKGVGGAHLDALARYPLWLAGQDFDHGTGHGVGAFLSVHEGPQRISRISDLPLQPGMILSNEPGYYREGAFGIRLENLIAVIEAPVLHGGDDRVQYAFETLTFAPFDRRLILAERLSGDERDWLNLYHGEILRLIAPRVGEEAQRWLQAACAPI
jgi:Xaa-Pro aminopeptidase